MQKTIKPFEFGFINGNGPMPLKWFSIYFFSLFFYIASFSQNQSSIQLNSVVVPLEVQAGKGGKWIVTVDLAPKIHINDASSNMFYVKPRPVSGIRFGKPIYPKGVKLPYGTVYQSHVIVEIPISLESSAGAGEKILTADIQIQPCNETDGLCYPPEIKMVTSKLTVLATKETGSVSSRQTGISGKLINELERGSLLAFFLVFIGGILASLTPCVYPMIPITIAVIGVQTAGGKMKGFILSLFYVFGIAITFSILGILAAKTGSLFGAYSQSSIVLIIVSLIFLIMGLSMLGLFVLQMPASLAGRLRGKRRSGFLGAVLTGLIAGLIMSPCVSPLLVVILMWIAKTGDALLGFGLLFSFALGLGVLFILIGTFSGVLKNLPRFGGWTMYIEKLFGILLVMLSIYFIKTVIHPLIYRGLWAVFLLFLGTFLGAFSLLGPDADWKKKMGKALGLLAVMISACLVFFVSARYFGFAQMKSESIQPQKKGIETFWLTSDEQAFEQAKTSGKKILIDFYADWCTACRELDDKTWADASLQRVLSDWVCVRLDLSRHGESTAILQKKYSVIGMPTVILFNSEGKELDRFSGFKPPEEVEELLRNYVSKN